MHEGRGSAPAFVCVSGIQRGLAQLERRLDPHSQAEIDARFFAIATDLVGTPTELVSEAGDIAWHTRTTLPPGAWSGQREHNRAQNFRASTGAVPPPC
jgi:uncharacterized protein RhaS with RHS repeats